MNCYSNGLGCLMPCESLDEFRETETHLKTRDSCHESTFFRSGCDKRNKQSQSTIVSCSITLRVVDFLYFS